MTRHLFHRLGLLLVGSLLGTPAVAQGGRFDLARTKTVLSALIEQSIAERGVPSISIALVKNDAIVWKAAFGHANVRTRTPATPETIYSTGSTFKSATATALMQLVEQGKLRLDDPVNQHLGDIRIQDRLQTEKPVTVTHILSHWSGLTPGAVTKPIWGRELPKPLEAMVSDLYSIRAPEVRYEYNNFAYGMAGLLVEKISGTDYEKYMLANVLEPLGVATPHPVYPSPEMVELMALPYMPGGSHGTPEPVAQVHFDVYPAGDIYLTAEDMARFLGAHLNGGVFNGKRILAAESVRDMQQPRFGGSYGFGFGIRRDSASGHTIIAHSGGIPGQSSYMMGDVDARVGVYYMSNSGAPPEIGEAALKLLRGEDYVAPPARKGIAVETGVLDRYAGTYRLSPREILTISRLDRILVVAQGEGRARNELLAESPTRFWVRGTNIAIVFPAAERGGADSLIVESGGRSRTARRSR